MSELNSANRTKAGPSLRERYDAVMAKPSSEDFTGEDLHELAAVGREALDEIERLRAGIWKMVGILGFDQDGAEHHHLAHPDIVEYGVRAATEARADHEEALRE